MRDKRVFTLGSKKIGEVDLFFVVEEGQANLGDFNKALDMIDVAAETGADAIEFQLARAGDFYIKSNPGFQIYLEREFSEAQHQELISHAKEKGLEFVAAPLSHKLIEPLTKAGCSGFNINASDLTNPNIIDAVLDSGVPFFLSLLFAKEEEIQWAVNRIQKNGNARFGLLHGQHTMASGEHGVDLEHTSLGYLAVLQEKFQVPVGFIDHTPFDWTPSVAVSAGADVITKHLALSRSEKGPDWHVCLEPEEMKKAIALARAAKKSINVKTKVLAPGENFDRSVMRRSIVAAKTIPAGKVIERNDIEFKRPGDGFDPSRYGEIVGQVSCREIREDEQIKFSDFKEM